jgi:hypothetical protein
LNPAFYWSGSFHEVFFLPTGPQSDLVIDFTAAFFRHWCSGFFDQSSRKLNKFIVTQHPFQPILATLPYETVSDPIAREWYLRAMEGRALHPAKSEVFKNRA